MTLVKNVTAAKAYEYTVVPGGSMLAVFAQGEVSTTGWTNSRLSPRLYTAPPQDGIWDFDFVADAPTGIVLEVVTPVAAALTLSAPAWIKGVRIHAAQNSIDTPLSKVSKLSQGAQDARKPLKAAKSNVIVQRDLASYEDSFQPTGATKYDPWPHAQMKKLVHRLVLTVEGPDGAKVDECLQQALTAGLIAAIVAACATGGAAIPAAVSAFLSQLTACLGSSYSARVDDQSHWEFWWT